MTVAASAIAGKIVDPREYLENWAQNSASSLSRFLGMRQACRLFR
jgi:hypothetical protein